MWNLFLPRTHEYGAGLTNVQYAPLAEITGRNPWIAPEAINCSAPDTGNMELLSLFGTEDQQRRWLEPLLEGEIRSAFSMTEPEVASSDATNITTRIERDGDDYVINGRKWWTSGAMSPRCTLLIVMGVTDPDAERHRRQSMILVPKDTPGVKIQRSTSLFGYDDGPHGGHAEIVYDDVRVPASNLLGTEGDGFRIAQERLGPGRIHHAMRTIGMAERALEMMCERTAQRSTFGRPIIDHGVVQRWISEARVRIEQVRLLVLKTAWLMDTVGNRGRADRGLSHQGGRARGGHVGHRPRDPGARRGRRGPGHAAARALCRGAHPADRRRTGRGPSHGDRAARDGAVPGPAGRDLNAPRQRVGRPSSRCRPASTSGATRRSAWSKPDPTMAPPAARAAIPWQTTPSLK